MKLDTFICINKCIKFSIWLAIFAVINCLRSTTYRHQQTRGILPGTTLPEPYCNQLPLHFGIQFLQCWPNKEKLSPRFYFLVQHLDKQMFIPVWNHRKLLLVTVCTESESWIISHLKVLPAAPAGQVLHNEAVFSAYRWPVLVPAGAIPATVAATFREDREIKI